MLHEFAATQGTVKILTLDLHLEKFVAANVISQCVPTDIDHHYQEG